MPETETAEEISKKPEVRKELERAGEKEPAKKVKAATTDKFWFVTHGLLLLGCAILYYLIGTKLLPLIQSEVDLGRRFLRGFAFVVIVLATTLWEFGGQYISGDHPSGRVIRFPNEKVLDEIVWNYSWPLFPYIWNEIKFQVAYQSDLKFVAETMQRIVTEEIGKEMMERVSVYRDLLARTPVDELEVREHPRVIFRVDEMTWIDAIVRYLVAPREAGPVKAG